MESRQIMKSHPIMKLTLLALSLCVPFASIALAGDVNFSRDVLPVLSDRCFHCHGPDEDNREADLRLDVEDDAKTDLGGYQPIAPGDLDNSEVWQRITSDDDDMVMPPTDSHRKPMTEKEREAIRQWILDGAKWGKHWSFEPPVRASVRQSVPSLSKHPIDAFVREKLQQEGFEPSRRAEPHTQIRRLAFDLTGMAPTPDDVQRFVDDPSDEAWLAAVNRLLKSPHHAERLAMWWLDAARYSDSDGFQQDATRQNWPWRDWVIQSFQKNMPFDQFTIEQFAGDLLPDATPEQILATCFHRNHMTNGEGGRDPEESRIDYVIDRVNTTGTVWLGLTLGCTQCHTHKFDPVSHHDYYSLSAFFNSIDEDGKAGMKAKPYLKYESSAVADRVAELQRFVEACDTDDKAAHQSASKRFDDWLASLLVNKPDDYEVWRTVDPKVTSSDGTQFRVEADKTVQTFGSPPIQDDYRVIFDVPENATKVSGWRVEILPNSSHKEGRFARDGNGEFVLTSVRVLLRLKGSQAETELELSDAVADYESDKKNSKYRRGYANIKDTLNDDARDGWTTDGAEEIMPHIGVYSLVDPVTLATGDRLVFVLRHRSTGGHANIGRFRISIAAELGETVQRVDGVTPIGDLLVDWPKEASAIDGKLRERLLAQFLLGDEEYRAAHTKLLRAQQQLKSLQAEQKPRSVMVLAERKEARDTYVLERGVWDAKGDSVQPAVLPAVLPWPEEKSRTRLDLANWLVDRNNPLTARVVVNQLWQLMFGSGIVRTPEDFGLQGEFPTHPKLIDWLAVELMENDWDIRHIIRLIVTSEMYRQSSVVTAELLERDPENRLLARGPRFRLPAWMLRDNALRVSGLLNPAVGGPPVSPFQPAGIWAEITMGRFHYDPSLGPAQYRRTLYAYWRRSSAPTFLFDNAQRRVCEVSVRRTNTPLHALTLMNDPNMLEASRVLADACVGGESIGDTDNLQKLAQRVLGRTLDADEISDCRSVWEKAIDYYESDCDQARTYTRVGQQTEASDALAAETAAWMTVAGLLMNLDEAISHE